MMQHAWYRPVGLSLAVALAVAFPSADARACGGCFHPTVETTSTVVTGHRMAFSISPDQTVLWDQIQYAGAPKDFAWVLPVKAGAVLELSSDAWLETLDAATTAQVRSPPFSCGTPGGSGSGPGCGACFGGAAEADYASSGNGGSGPGTAPVQPVTVTHEGTVGPYQTVTLHANVPNALPAWLMANGYNLDASVAPIVDAYTAAGFDFIALRLSPGQGVQAMKPVRVVTPGMSPTLPLRMVSAGTGANVSITLFVIGEGRWQAQNFPNGTVDPSALVWDYGAQSSNYATLRRALMAQNGGKTWNTAFSQQGALLSEFGLSSTGIIIGDGLYLTFADAYVAQGVANGEASPTSCTNVWEGVSQSSMQVSGQCLAASSAGTASGGTGGAGTGGAGTGGAGAGGAGTMQPCMVPASELDARQLVCGGLDDLAMAFVGLHPVDVWLTRLESNLPHAALATDLIVQAAPTQTPVSNVLSASQSTGNPCAVGLVADGGPRFGLRNRLAIAGAILSLVAAFVLRRRRRVPVLVPARVHAR